MAKNKTKSKRDSSPKGKSIGKGRPNAKQSGGSTKSAPVATKATKPVSGSRKGPGVKPGEPVSTNIVKRFKRTLLRAYLGKS